MTELSNRERELVAIGAAIASNCVPCVEYHIPEARKAGLTDAQIAEAVRFADKVRQVPAQKVLATAMTMLNVSPAEPGLGTSAPSCHDVAGPTAEKQSCCG